MEKEEVDKMGQWHLWRIGDLNRAKQKRQPLEITLGSLLKQKNGTEIFKMES